MERIKKICTAILFFYSAFSANAQSPDNDFYRADSLIDARQFEAGIQVLDQLIGTAGEKENYLTLRAYAWLNLQQKTKAKTDYERALALNPGCIKCLVNMGIMAADDGDYTIALPLYDQAIKLDSSKAMAWIKRGELFYQAGEPEKALADFNKAMTLDVNSPYIYLWRSMTHLSMGKNAAALSDINKSIQLKPEVEYAYFIRGKCLIQQGRYDDAWKDLSSCLQKNPDFNQYHTYAGIALYNLGQPDKAMQAFNESIRLDSTGYLPYRYRSYLNYDNGKFSLACHDKEKALQILLDANNEPEVIKELQAELNEYCNTGAASFYKHTGDALFQLGLYERAAFSYSAGLKKFSNDPVLSEGMGNTAIAAGKFEEALTYYYQCLAGNNRIDPLLLVNTFNSDKKNATDFFMAQLHNSIAFAQINLLRTDSAILNLNKAITLLQQNKAIYQSGKFIAAYLTKRGTLYSIRQDYNAAQADFSEAIRLNPQYAAAYLERATMLINKNTMEPGKAGNTKSVYQPDPGGPYIYSVTPVKNMDKTGMLNAIKDCDKAISLEPGNAMAFMRRAQLSYLLKKGTHCADLSKAAALGMGDAARLPGVNCK